MKHTLLIALLLAVGATTFAQRQKVSVGKDGEMIVNGDTIAYIEKEGCKLLSSECVFTIVDENDDLLITVRQESFSDRERQQNQPPAIIIQR